MKTYTEVWKMTVIKKVIPPTSDTVDIYTWISDTFDQFYSIVGYGIRPINALLGSDSAVSISLWVKPTRYIEADRLDAETYGYSEILAGYLKCRETLSIPGNKAKYVFRNPPIDYWLESKDNWINNRAQKYCQKYANVHMTYEDIKMLILERIWYIYSKGNVYMGNLTYIEIAIENAIKRHIRYELNRLSLSKNNVVSIYDVVYENDSGDSLLIGDTLEAKETIDEGQYEDLVKFIKKTMKKRFSSREIDLILKDIKATNLPRPLYVKLIKWRSTREAKTLLSEVLNDEL